MIGFAMDRLCINCEVVREQKCAHRILVLQDEKIEQLYLLTSISLELHNYILQHHSSFIPLLYQRIVSPLFPLAHRLHLHTQDTEFQPQASAFRNQSLPLCRYRTARNQPVSSKRITLSTNAEPMVYIAHTPAPRMLKPAKRRPRPRPATPRTSPGHHRRKDASPCRFPRATRRP